MNLPRLAVAIDLPDGITAFIGNMTYTPGMHLPQAPVFYPLVGPGEPPAIRNTAADCTMLAEAAGWADFPYRIVPAPAVGD